MQRIKNILCVVEHGKDSKPALDRAVALAESNQAALTVVDLAPRLSRPFGLPGGDGPASDLQAALTAEREARLNALLQPYREQCDIQQAVLIGTSFLEVIRMVLRNQHDLVIKCPESPSWLGRFFSGDDMHLLRKCPCPVWLVKPGTAAGYRRILAAVDIAGGYPEEELEVRHDLNLQVLAMAASLAIAESAELHVVHAWESFHELASELPFATDVPADKLASLIEEERRQDQRLLDRLMADFKNSSQSAAEAMSYLQPELHLEKGGARKEIPALAKRLAVDCIAMGTVARTGIPGFIMGNTAETILEQLDCSVLAIKPKGFVTPVTLGG